MTNTNVYTSEIKFICLHKTSVDKDIYIVLNEISDTNFAVLNLLCVSKNLN